MKKVALSLLVLAIVGTSAFAEVKFGSWGRGIFAPIVSNGTDLGTAIGTTWGGDVRVGFTATGEAKDMGWKADIRADNGTITGDAAHIWVMPIDKVKLQVGKGGFGLGAGAYTAQWDWIRPWWPKLLGDDAIMQGAGGTGFGVDVTMVENLDVFVWIPAAKITDAYGNKTVAGLSYTIAGVGAIRAQYKGDNGGTGAEKSFINAAFKLTAVSGLNFDIGIKYFLKADDAGESMRIATAVDYSLDKLKINAMFGYQAPKAGDADMEAGVGANYDLGGMNVIGDLWYRSQPKTAWDYSGSASDMSILLGVQKGMSQGKIGIGVQYLTTKFMGPNFASTAAPATGAAVDDKTKAHFVVPITFEYWF